LITSVGSETAPITEFELACLVVALVVLLLFWLEFHPLFSPKWTSSNPVRVRV